MTLCWGAKKEKSCREIQKLGAKNLFSVIEKKHGNVCNERKVFEKMRQRNNKSVKEERERDYSSKTREHRSRRSRIISVRYRYLQPLPSSTTFSFSLYIFISLSLPLSWKSFGIWGSQRRVVSWERDWIPRRFQNPVKWANYWLRLNH